MPPMARPAGAGCRPAAVFLAVAAVSGAVGIIGPELVALRPVTGRLRSSARVDRCPAAEPISAPITAGRQVGDGLSEELSAQLGPGSGHARRCTDLALCIPRPGCVRAEDRPAARRALCAGGSIRRELDRAQVTAQLIDATTGFHRWTASYDRPWQDLLSIQQELSKAITAELRVVMSPEQAQRVSASTTKDPRAYEIYLSGLASLRQGGGLSGSSRPSSSSGQRSRWIPVSRVRTRVCARRLSCATTARVRRIRWRPPRQPAARPSRPARRCARPSSRWPACTWPAARSRRPRTFIWGLLPRDPRDADVHHRAQRGAAGPQASVRSGAQFPRGDRVEPAYSFCARWPAVFPVPAAAAAARPAQAYRRVTELAPANSSGFNNLGAHCSGPATCRPLPRVPPLRPNRAIAQHLREPRHRALFPAGLPCGGRDVHEGHHAGP